MWSFVAEGLLVLCCRSCVCLRLLVERVCVCLERETAWAGARVADVDVDVDEDVDEDVDV